MLAKIGHLSLFVIYDCCKIVQERLILLEQWLPFPKILNDMYDI